MMANSMTAALNMNDTMWRQCEGRLERLWAVHAGALSEAMLYSFIVPVIFGAIHVGGLTSLLLPRSFPWLFAGSKLQLQRNPPPISSIARAYTFSFLVYTFLVFPAVLLLFPILKVFPACLSKLKEIQLETYRSFA
jgi:hypothetical protein